MRCGRIFAKEEKKVDGGGFSTLVISLDTIVDAITCEESKLKKIKSQSFFDCSQKRREFHGNNICDSVVTQIN